MHEVLKDDGVKGNLLTYNEMIRACCKQGLTSTSLDVFKDMEKNGVMADELTFNMLIDHLANVAKQVNKCLEFITKMKERGFKPTATTYSHVLDAFGKQGRLFDMMRMLGMCFDCDVIVVIAVVDICCLVLTDSQIPWTRRTCAVKQLFSLGLLDTLES